MNILIQSPSYAPASGGIRVLHYFGYLAFLAGHNVKMQCHVLNPEWGHYSNDTLKRFDLKILPEIYPATFDDGVNVIRWVLYFPGKILNGPTKYPKHEMVVAYDKLYLDEATKAADGRKVSVFHLPYINMTGIDDELPRENIATVWYGKGPMINIPELNGYPVITRSWPSPRYKLIHFMKSTITLYSFDRYSVLLNEAVMCGCNVMVWDGEKFIPYIEKNPEREIMDITRDLISVSEFIDSSKKYFGIKDN